MAVVKVPTLLRGLSNGERQVVVPALTVGELLQDLERRFPGFRDRLCEPDGSLRSFISIYVGRVDIRLRAGLATPLSDADEIFIVPAMSGG